MKNAQASPLKTEKFHLGIYAIITKGDSVLLVKKSRGPYRGKWDLPGGSPMHGESILQTLHREVLEEAGIRLDCVDHHSNFAFTVEYKEADKSISLHHTCLVYMARDFFDYWENSLFQKFFSIVIEGNLLPMKIERNLRRKLNTERKTGQMAFTLLGS